MLNKKTLLLCILFFSIIAKSESYYKYINVGLFVNNKISELTLTSKFGSFQVLGDQKLIINLKLNDTLIIKFSDNLIKLNIKSTKPLHVSNTNDTFLFNESYYFKNLKLIPEDENSNYFYIKPNSPNIKSREYHGILKLNALNKDYITIINNVLFKQYLAGVVRYESGLNRELEYYKAQAIISRTYALKNWNKHIELGYNLCDRINSQVYKGKCNDETILQGIKDTKGLVIVDEKVNLIIAAFHSNSGGQTLNSEDVWVTPVSYLKGTIDSFSIDMPNYRWQKKILKQQWINYFLNNYDLNITNKMLTNIILKHCPEKRIPTIPKINVKVKSIRNFFHLRSDYFCVTQQGDSIILDGKGYGHGIGLSQEGAMKMAKLGYSYLNILRHYYNNIYLVQISSIDLFK